jgi:N-formylmaleamate deformylase
LNDPAAEKQSRFYVVANGVKIHFLDYGSGGPNLLLLPGITTPAILWGFVSERIARYARVIAIDNRGRGLSDQRPGLTYRLQDYAADAAGVIEALSLKDVVVLGHSMGARIGIKLAAEYPNLVSRLILADPPVSGPGRRPYPSPLQQYFDNIDRILAGEAGPARGIYTPEQDRLRYEWIATCSKEAVAETHAGFHQEDIFELMPRIKCPTLLLYAGKGDTVRDADADEIVANVSGAIKKKLENVGHMMPWFDIELFLGSIEGFIKAEPATRKAASA